MPMKLIPRLRPLGARWLLWLGCGGLTSILVLIGFIDFVRLQSMATSFQKDHNAAKPRASAGQELEINIIGYSLSVWRYLSGFDAARQRAARDAADVALQLNEYTELAETARQRELAARLRTGWQDVHALGEAQMAARTANPAAAARFTETVERLEQFLDSELQPDAVKAYEALNAKTHGSLQKSEIVTLSLLFFGLAIALATSMAVGRAVLAGEAQLRDSEERLTRVNTTLEQTVAERTQELREINGDLDQRVAQRTRAQGDSQM